MKTMGAKLVKVTAIWAEWQSLHMPSDVTKSGTVPVGLTLDVFLAANVVEVKGRSARCVAPLGAKQIEAEERASRPTKPVDVTAGGIAGADQSHLRPPSGRCVISESQIDSISIDYELHAMCGQSRRWPSVTYGIRFRRQVLSDK